MDFIAEHKDFFGIGSMILVFIVATWLSNRARKPKKVTGWQGYYGYQFSGPGEIEITVRSGSGWLDYVRSFGVGSLGMASRDVDLQIAKSLEIDENEITLTNHLKESFLFRRGSGRTLYRTALSPDRPLKKVSPGRALEEEDD